VIKAIISNLIVLSVSFGGAIACAHLLYKDIYHNRASVEGYEVAGKIADKTQIVKRKLGDNMIWDLIESNETLYWNDSVQTAEKSTAQIELENGNKISIGEQSLIVLEKDNDSLSLKLKSGQLVVDADAAGANGLKINGMDMSGNVSLQMDDEKGRILATTDGKQMIIDQNGKVIERDLKVALTSPETMSQVFIENSSGDIPLTWKNKAGKAVEVTIALDRNCKKILEKKTLSDDSFEFKGSPGVYYWRVKVLDEKDPFVSETRSFNIVQIQKPRIFPASENKRVTFKKDIPTVDFSWQAIEGVNKYTFELAHDEDFQKVAMREESRGNTLRTSKLKAGTFFWHVVVHFGSQTLTSQLAKITIEQLQASPPPILQFPVKGFKATIDYFEKAQGLPFRWEVKTDEPYRFVLSRSPKLKDEVISFETTLSETTIKEPLRAGVYYWSVGYQDIDGVWRYSDIRQIEMDNLVPLLQPPPILSPLADTELDLLKSPKVKWSWQQVAGAKNYKFKLFKVERGNENLLINESIKTLSKEETDLPDGNYRWQVSSVDEFGRESKPMTTDFTISHGQTLKAPDFDMSEVQ
jgi:hypothetical protein